MKTNTGLFAVYRNIAFTFSMSSVSQVAIAMVLDGWVANLARVIENCNLDGRDGYGTRRLSS